MNFEETFKSWTLDKKVEWALGPSICNLSENMRSIIVDLKDENDRLKTELKKWEDRSKVVKDGYDGEVYEWEDNYYIVTPHLNVFVKGLLKENAKLKSLALHLFERVAMKESDEWLELQNTSILNIEDMWLYKKHEERWLQIAKKCGDAYRKAKKELEEGK